MRTSVARAAVFLIGMAGSASGQSPPTCQCGSRIDSATVCLTEKQMSHGVKHIEMRPDRMGNHVNVDGFAVFELTLGKNGRVLNAKAKSGHPLALPLLIDAMDTCRFQPIVRKGSTVQACGQLTVKFSVVQNMSKVEVVRP